MKKYNKIILLNFILLFGCSTYQKKVNNTIFFSAKAIRGSGKIFIDNGEKTDSQKFVFIATKNGNLRMEFLTFFNYTIAYLFIDNNNYTFYSPMENRAWRGETGNIAKLGILPNFFSSKLLTDIFFQNFDNIPHQESTTDRNNKTIKELQFHNGLKLYLYSIKNNYSRKMLITFKNYKIRIEFNTLETVDKINEKIFKPNLPKDVKIMEY